MIAALICGRLEQDRFPGRNMVPLLGKPMMVYPILAALHSSQIQEVYMTTDSPLMASVAAQYGVQVIQRPPELCLPSTSLEEVIEHGYQHILEATKDDDPFESLVVLLSNAPIITTGLIDQGLEILSADVSLDSVISVSLRNTHHPKRALHINRQHLLSPMLDPKAKLNQGTRQAYFANAVLSVLRPRCFEQVSPLNFPIRCVGNRVAPLVHEGYGDIDFPWQLPAVEEWLRRHGFSETKTPYESLEKIAPVKWASHSEFRAKPPVSTLEKRVLITTVPFGEIDRKPLDLLEANGVEYVINPIGRKLKEEELADLIGEFGILIAGTEPITNKVIAQAPHLLFISRVGIGLDSVDLQAARQRDVLVSYTPDAPAPAVAELTMGLILSLLRYISMADRGIRNGVWHRYMGRRLAEMTVGVIGVGRIGKRVIRHLSGFGPRIIANDIQPDLIFGNDHDLIWADKEVIYQEADIITLHVPLTPDTHYLVDEHELALMKAEAVLINTARGPIVNEQKLANALRSGHLGGAAIDVFEQEPYSGELVAIENCLLTCHMGSGSRDCRSRMEIEATKEAIRFLKGEPLQGLVPESEYRIHRGNR